MFNKKTCEIWHFQKWVRCARWNLPAAGGWNLSIYLENLKNLKNSKKPKNPKNSFSTVSYDFYCLEISYFRVFKCEQKIWPHKIFFIFCEIFSKTKIAKKDPKMALNWATTLIGSHLKTKTIHADLFISTQNTEDGKLYCKITIFLVKRSARSARR